MKMQSVIKKFKWPARLLLFVLLYLFIANWMANHQERLNEVVLHGSFEDFDYQKYEQFNEAKSFYKYVKYLPWISVADPQIIALRRWDWCFSSDDFFTGESFLCDEFPRGFRLFLSKTDLLEKVVSRTEILGKLYKTMEYTCEEFNQIETGLDIIKFLNQGTPNIFINTEDSLRFLESGGRDTILLTGEIKSECCEVLNQLSYIHDLWNPDFWYSYNEELFLDSELDDFVLEHKMAFETFGYIVDNPAAIAPPSPVILCQ